MTPAEAFSLKNELGLNCAQTLLAHFAPRFSDKISKDAMVAMGLNFGAGMNKGDVCGSVSAAYMILGLAFFNPNLSHDENRDLRLQKTREFDEKFIQSQKTNQCKELLGFNPVFDTPSNAQSDAVPAVCGGSLAAAINILKSMLG
ncbi:C-GCAxxG-C-C family protein [Campylobacter sp. 19-13652]|uniref:C-GCAxxG-C-C family protein n=1 Tax=Campylobacter sp. 19-13652 TaxID=2840180 RepID=UPI001C77340D|nr:C-GCAxxG-C-C family protein [Campylobacter sp. 19-13652]BCX79179.1 hypothetical protein LBC_06410 [Campylobacter sp. 19-13652]